MWLSKAPAYHLTPQNKISMKHNALWPLWFGHVVAKWYTRIKALSGG